MQPNVKTPSSSAVASIDCANIVGRAPFDLENNGTDEIDKKYCDCSHRTSEQDDVSPWMPGSKCLGLLFCRIYFRKPRAQ